MSDTPTRIHCATCTCSPKPSTDDCNAVRAINHETFACYGLMGHDGPHWAIRQIPACPTCHGYDEHREGCADIALTTPDSERFEWTTPVPSEPPEARRDV